MLDVNCPWSVDEARAVADEIAVDDFHWLEEPVWPPEDFTASPRSAPRACPSPPGRASARSRTSNDCSRRGPSTSSSPASSRSAASAPCSASSPSPQAYAVRVVPHCFYWGPGYLATAHVIAAMTRPTPLETAFITLEARPHPLFDPETPTLTLPEAPGLGFEPDMAVMERYRLTRTVLGG